MRDYTCRQREFQDRLQNQRAASSPEENKGVGEGGKNETRNEVEPTNGMRYCMDQP